jgi:hypothetical protein
MLPGFCKPVAALTLSVMLLAEATQDADQDLVRVAEIPCKPGAGLGKDRLKSASTNKSQALPTELHSVGICG